MTNATLRRALTLALALCLTGVSPSGATGYADVARLIASHPLHAVLAGYDREIAALRTTLRATGLTDPAARTEHAAAALQRSAAATRARALRLDALNTSADLNTERNAIATIVRLRGTGDLESSSYGVELDRETSASLTAFEAATAQRTTRALEARRQQLRENELALAYALARRDAAEHLLLQLKLTHLHLDRTDRAALEAQRAALDRREADAIAALRRSDAATLAAYERELRAQAATANAQMTSQLRGTAAANRTIHGSVVRAESSAAGALPNFPAQLALFRAGYRSGAQATDIAGNLSAASDDISRRFGALARADRQSRSAALAQIRTLQAQRDALYHSIVAQITRAASRIAEERHLSGVSVAPARRAGSVDLTGAIRSSLAGF
ncbi:MAG TPA: hypothetical protein VGG51_00550 [Candidatus Cybelea sp.]